MLYFVNEYDEGHVNADLNEHELGAIQEGKPLGRGKLKYICSREAGCGNLRKRCCGVLVEDGRTLGGATGGGEETGTLGGAVAGG